MFLWIANSMAAGSLSTGAFEVSYGADNASHRLVRKTPSWPRSWANFSLLQLYMYSHRNA
jgi:hypothetical protein